MPEAQVVMNVRKPGPGVGVIDIEGEVTAFCEPILMDAYSSAVSDGADTVMLNFSGLEYMNSGGIGLLVTLLIRTQRHNQRLLAYGLNEHYQQIFQLTRLDEAISIFESETSAVAALAGGTT